MPVHLQEAYADLEHRPGDFPIAERVASDCLSLPLFPEMTDEQQDRVVAALHEILMDGSRGSIMSHSLQGSVVLVTGGAGLIGSHIVDL